MLEYRKLLNNGSEVASLSASSLQFQRASVRFVYLLYYLIIIIIIIIIIS